MKLKQLISLAIELNDGLGLEPPIDYELRKDLLIVQLQKAIKLIIEDDTFSPASIKLIEELKRY